MLPCVLRKGTLIMQLSTKPNPGAQLQSGLAQGKLWVKEERERCALVEQKKVEWKG